LLPTILEHSFRISNPSGDDIRGDMRYAVGTRTAPVVVICHGFTAFKDWGPFPYFGKRFAEHGFITVAFNFSHNGIGTNPRKFTEFEKFSTNTIGKELEDLRAIIDALDKGTLGAGVVDPGRIAVVGHSRGGAIALLGAGEDRRIRAVAAWATVATVHRYTRHQQETWERQGYLPVSVRSSKTRLRFGLSVLQDLEANRIRYDLERAMHELHIPVLLVHGKADVSVRPEEPMRLYAASDKSTTELVLLDHVGHTFGAKHPFRGHHPAVDHIIDLTAQWFTLHL
jgi:dipeptidyl aminopeptidase/acylaminoacyl peptidase